MMKIAVAAVLVVATAILASDVPMLHSVRAKAALGPKSVAIQRCANTGCTEGCETIVEFPLSKCHPSWRAFSHGEIFRVASVSNKRMCFRESMYESKDNQGCGGSAKLIQSAPRELGQCVDDVFPPGRFSQFIGNGTALIMRRDCDFGCKTCGMEMPIEYGQCIKAPFDRREKFADIAFHNSAPFECGGDGWQEIIADHFLDNTCFGMPDFVNTQFADMCYVFFGHGHKFVIQN